MGFSGFLRFRNWSGTASPIFLQILAEQAELCLGVSESCAELLLKRCSDLGGLLLETSPYVIPFAGHEAVCRICAPEVLKGLSVPFDEGTHLGAGTAGKPYRIAPVVSEQFIEGLRGKSSFLAFVGLSGPVYRGDKRVEALIHDLNSLKQPGDRLCPFLV
jgi:hypothetical protein